MRGVTLAKQIRSVRREMAARPAGLARHVERVMVEALDLARRWDADPERVELAVWGHDLFRAHRPADQLKLAREVGLALTEDDIATPVMVHGPVAALVLRERFGVTDDDVLAAVREHTSGAVEMPLIAKIMLVADKVERRKRKRAPVMRAVRELARRDLDLALLCWADWKWVDEKHHGWTTYPAHWLARQRWVAEHHAGIGLPGRMEGEAFESEV
ncbi:MAG: bis(5'-nucleosyl)-tetraphosphatase (symmetrical) YqeK [Dehalococcoidia bacterium]